MLFAAAKGMMVDGQAALPAELESRVLMMSWQYCLVWMRASKLLHEVLVKR